MHNPTTTGYTKPVKYDKEAIRRRLSNRVPDGVHTHLDTFALGDMLIVHVHDIDCDTRMFCMCSGGRGGLCPYYMAMLLDVFYHDAYADCSDDPLCPFEYIPYFEDKVLYRVLLSDGHTVTVTEDDMFTLQDVSDAFAKDPTYYTDPRNRYLVGTL